MFCCTTWRSLFGAAFQREGLFTAKQEPSQNQAASSSVPSAPRFPAPSAALARKAVSEADEGYNTLEYDTDESPPDVVEPPQVTGWAQFPGWERLREIEAWGARETANRATRLVQLSPEEAEQAEREMADQMARVEIESRAALEEEEQNRLEREAREEQAPIPDQLEENSIYSLLISTAEDLLQHIREEKFEDILETKTFLGKEYKKC